MRNRTTLGFSYDFSVKVQARNSQSWGPPSPRSSPFLCSTPPLPPSGLRKDNDFAEQTIHLKWDPVGPSRDGGLPVTGYTIYRWNTEKIVFERIGNASASSTVFEDRDKTLVGKHAYRYFLLKKESWNFNLKYLTILCRNKISFFLSQSFGAMIFLVVFPKNLLRYKLIL